MAFPAWMKLEDLVSIFRLAPPLLTGALVACFVGLWVASSRSNPTAAKLYWGLGFLTILGIAPVLLGNGRGIFQFSPATGFVHYGFVEYILLFGHLDPSVEGFFMAAPSAWLFHTSLAAVTGLVDGPTLIAWTPLVAYIIVVATVCWIVRTLTMDRSPMAGLMGACYFAVANIGGLLTFQASTGAIILYLCALGLIGRLNARRSNPAAGDTLVLLVLVIALPWQHPLIASLLLLVIAVEGVTSHSVRGTVVAVGVAMLVAWLVYFASAALVALGPSWYETILQIARAFVLAGRRAEAGSELHSLIFESKVLTGLTSLSAAAFAALLMYRSSTGRQVLRRSMRIAFATIAHGLGMGGIFHLELPIRTFVLLLAPLSPLIEYTAANRPRLALVVLALIVIGIPYRIVGEFGSPANLLAWTDISAGRFMRDETDMGLVAQGPFPRSGGYVRDPTKYEPASYEDVLSGRWMDVQVAGASAERVYIVLDPISRVDYAYERRRPSTYNLMAAWVTETAGVDRIFSNGEASIHLLRRAPGRK